MKRIVLTLLVSIFFSSCGDSSSSPSAPVDPHQSNGVTVGFEGVTGFDSLSDTQIQGVRGLKVFFAHASVGKNTINGLNDVNGLDAKYTLSMYSGSVSAIKSEFTAGTDHFADYEEGNPGWGLKVSDFEANINSGVAEVSDVCMMKLCFIDSWESSEPKAGYAAKFNAYRDMMLRMEAKYPNTAFIWWTMPICTAGDTERDGFNTLVRNYASENKKWLFDVASVESHDSSGKALSDSTGETMCADYNLSDGGHPDTAAGELRLGEALYVLLAKVAEARAQ